MLDPKMKVDQLDIRGYFAAMAMQGNLANPNIGYNAETNAKDALRQADALIKELSK